MKLVCHATEFTSFLLFSIFIFIKLLTIPVISVPNAQTTPLNMNDIITALCQYYYYSKVLIKHRH